MLENTNGGMLYEKVPGKKLRAIAAERSSALSHATYYEAQTDDRW